MYTTFIHLFAYALLTLLCRALLLSVFPPFFPSLFVLNRHNFCHSHAKQNKKLHNFLYRNSRVFFLIFRSNRNAFDCHPLYHALSLDRLRLKVKKCSSKIYIAKEEHSPSPIPPSPTQFRII